MQVAHAPPRSWHARRATSGQLRRPSARRACAAARHPVRQLLLATLVVGVGVLWVLYNPTTASTHYLGFQNGKWYHGTSGRVSLSTLARITPREVHSIAILAPFTKLIGPVPPAACDNVTTTLHGGSHIEETSLGGASDVPSSPTLGTGHAHGAGDRFVYAVPYCRI